MSAGTKTIALLVVVIVVATVALPEESRATPEYAERSGQGCTVCHLEGAGGPLTETGLRFAAGGYVWPATGGYRVLGPIRKTARLALGFFHVAGAFIWFGTILYVHLMLRPAYASKGLPRGEVRLGMLSMLVVGTTGVLLTVSRVNGWNVFFETPWGRTLSFKVLAYVVMVGSALFVVTWLGPRLKARGGGAGVPSNGIYFESTLSAYDGKEGTPALIAYRGTVYDVSALRLWKGGVHMKHGAGADLSMALAKAPHGEEMLERARVAGSFDPSRTPSLNINQKLFYVVAYLNLTLVFVVIGLLAWWRWGL